MPTVNYTFTSDAEKEPYITAARQAYNAGIYPQKVPVPAVPDAPADAPVIMVDNPEMIQTNVEYLQLMFTRLVDSYENQHIGKFRMPTGKWLARWTDEEIEAVRYVLAPNDPQVKAWLLELDRNENVNFNYPPTQAGVPAVCAALEQLGIIAPGGAAERAATLLALPGQVL